MEQYLTSIERKTKNKKQNPANPEFYKQKKSFKNEGKIKTFSSKTKLRILRLQTCSRRVRKAIPKSYTLPDSIYITF